jgi:hypothetical protein
MRPERLKILGKPFRVNYGHEAPLEDGDMGDCSTEGQVLTIRDGQPLENEQDCVLHEAIHALSDYMEIKLKEHQVTKLATGLLAVLKDNPSFVAYLKKKNAKPRTPAGASTGGA